jgi:hypothetical protein
MYLPALPRCRHGAHPSEEKVASAASRPARTVVFEPGVNVLTPGLSTTVYVPPSASRLYGGGRLTVVRVLVSQVLVQRSPWRIVPALPARQDEQDVRQLSTSLSAHVPCRGVSSVREGGVGKPREAMPWFRRWLYSTRCWAM